MHHYTLTSTDEDKKENYKLLRHILREQVNHDKHRERQTVKEEKKTGLSTA